MFSQQRSCVCLPLPPWPGVQTDSSERVGISANLGPRVSCAAVPTPWWHPCRAASSTSPPPFTSPHSCTSLSAEMSRQGRPTSARHGDAVGRKAAPHMSSPRAQGAPSPLHLPPAKKKPNLQAPGPTQSYWDVWLPVTCVCPRLATCVPQSVTAPHGRLCSRVQAQWFQPACMASF